MKIIVNPHKLEIEKTPVNEKEINITKCIFEFSEEITNNYVKEAYFTFENNTYKQIIVNNECNIPSEVLEEKGQVELGVVAFLVEDETEIKRYNPSPAYFNTWDGSLKEANNSEPITPSDKEQIEQAITDLDNNKQDKLISGENIKTINNESLLGSGNLDVITDLSDYYTKEEANTLLDSKVDNETLEQYTKTSDLSNVALSGNYNDLSNKPDLSVYATITYVNNLVGDIETILTTLDIGGGIQ